MNRHGITTIRTTTLTASYTASHSAGSHDLTAVRQPARQAAWGLIGQVFLLLGLLGNPQTILAHTWPDRAVRMIVPFTPGGGTDTLTRQLVEKMAHETRWSFVVENKPGAGGNIGMDAVAKAKNDGYTLGMGQTSNIAINPAAMAKMPFDPNRDLVPVILVAEVPMILVVRTDSPWQSLADLLKAAKAKPEEIKQALAGTGTVGHLAGELLAKRAGIRLTNVPYKGAAPALTDLIGGQTDCMFATPPSVMSLLQAGKLRALAVTSSKRLSSLPTVQTIAEQGYPKFEAVDWKVIMAPAGTPVDVIARINAAAQRALAMPAMSTRLAEEGSTPLGGSATDAARYLRDEQAEWASLIREAGIKFD